MVNPSPERKASIEVVDGGLTPRNAPVTDLSGPEASAESLTPRRSDLAVEDTVDSNSVSSHPRQRSVRHSRWEEPPVCRLNDDQR
jgi:hypothetical protein